MVIKLSDPVDTLTGMLMAAQLEIERLRAKVASDEVVFSEMGEERERLRADHERSERYEAGLRGEIQQLTERATLAEAKVQDLAAVAKGAGNTVERLKAQVKSLLTTLTQDDFPDPAILHADCRARLALAERWHHEHERMTESQKETAS